VLTQIVSRFIEEDRLEELNHGMDTNPNESFNNVISYFAPKNRVFCTTRSLETRVALAVGVVSVGFNVFYRRIFKALGITMTTPVVHWLEQKDKLRAYRLMTRKTTEVKKSRMSSKFDKLKEQEKETREKMAKKEGAYRSGGNMDEEGFFPANKNNNNKKPAAKKKRTATTPNICPHCGQKGHKTLRSKHCRFNPQNPEYVPPNEAVPLVASLPMAAASNASTTSNTEHVLNLDDYKLEEQMQADDVDNMDSMPLDDDHVPSDFEDEFYDCGTWSEDDDDGVIPSGII
jgi:hypothetical protein